METWLLMHHDSELGELRKQIETLKQEIENWHTAAIYSPLMSGQMRFSGWNRSQLDRCRREYIEQPSEHYRK